MEHRLLRDDRLTVGRGATALAGNAPVPLAVVYTQGTFLSLLGLRRALGDLVVPAPPRQEFRDQLHSQLVRAAQQQLVQRALSIAPTVTAVSAADTPGMPARLGHWLISDEQAGRRWVFGAAAVGSAVSLAGALALLLRSRVRRAA